jgi:hypothetical protein
MPPHNGRHHFFCRQVEKDAFPALKGSVLPNLPPRPARQGPPDFNPPATPALMFIGLLDYMPNEDAVDWFLGQVWPRVRQAVPNARFLLAGTVAEDRRARWACVEGVDVLGFVDDLAATYARATASIVPMRAGAGTNVKALEPLLYGKPVIATPLVLSGYRGIVDLEDVVLSADRPEAFARHCIDLLQHPVRAADLARRGHARIDARLDFAMFASIVDKAVSQVLANRSDGPPSVLPTEPTQMQNTQTLQNLVHATRWGEAARAHLRHHLSLRGRMTDLKRELDALIARHSAPAPVASPPLAPAQGAGPAAIEDVVSRRIAWRRGARE